MNLLDLEKLSAHENKSYKIVFFKKAQIINSRFEIVITSKRRGGVIEWLRLTHANHVNILGNGFPIFIALKLT